MRVDQDCQRGLAQHVNEARRDHHTARIKGAFGRSAAEKANGGDASVANADVARVPGRTCAVNDVAVADDEVVRRGLGVESSEGEEKDKGKERAARKF